MSRALPTRLSLLVAAFAISTTTLLPQEKGKVVAYVPNWIDLESFSKTIEFDKITHINIAFENPTNDQGDLSYHQKNDLLITAAHAHNVKILVSIGGGSASGNRTTHTRISLRNIPTPIEPIRSAKQSGTTVSRPSKPRPGTPSTKSSPAS